MKIVGFKKGKKKCVCLFLVFIKLWVLVYDVDCICKDNVFFVGWNFLKIINNIRYMNFYVFIIINI